MTGVFRGERVGRDDPRYPTLVRGFNLRWVGAPCYVELCGSAEQVRDTVQRALDDGLRITIQGGGHCYENFAVGNEGGAIVELSAMNAVLHAVEVVVVRHGRAEIVTVSRDSTDPDDELLMWGHLGACGGNFDIVTKYCFRDPPRAPREAHLLSIAWDWDTLDRRRHRPSSRTRSS